MMATMNIIEKIQKKFGDKVVETHSFRGDDTIVVKKESIKEICTFLRDDKELDFDYLVDLCGADYFPRDPRFEVVYHMHSIAKRHRLRVKVKLADAEKIASVVDVWLTADWLERETFDMYGIEFEGHPELKRIYMDDDWVGYPLRKDYPERGYKDEYQPFGEEE
jgi:NADH-quinone oxidoreductase subunit C